MVGAQCADGYMHRIMLHSEERRLERHRGSLLDFLRNLGSMCATWSGR